MSTSGDGVSESRIAGPHRLNHSFILAFVQDMLKPGGRDIGK
jgi:hypothetical protein